MIDAWNTAGLDYATFGNHEFDFGPEVLRERMKESRFKWIAANVIDSKTGKPFGDAEAYVIREFDGVKVGIFGLTFCLKQKLLRGRARMLSFSIPAKLRGRWLPNCARAE